MPVPAYTAEHLALFSTILAAGARLRGWSRDLGVGGGEVAVQEVQCMRMNDGLYIAGNHGEHAAIADYLRAFGVTDHASFINCLKYTNWLFTVPHGQRNGTVGRGYVATFSATEQAAIAYAGAGLGQIPVMTAPEILAARALVTTAVLPAPGDRTLAWFLRKFTGAAAIVGLNRPVAGAINYVGQYNGPHELTLINDGSGVHAELKLARVLTRAYVVDTLRMADPGVAIGGLKRACSYCEAWLTRYVPWMALQYRVVIQRPANDNRAQGGGAGDRPSNVGEAGFGQYVQALFNGAANSNCADVAAHANDDEW